MTYNKDEAKKIQETELLVIRSTIKERSYRRILRVVQFTVNGVTNAPKIDNRLYRDNDSTPYGRTVSLDFQDAETIVKRWDEIRACWMGK